MDVPARWRFPRFLASIRHPNIVNFMEAFVGEASMDIYIVMEFADGGDVAEKVKACVKARQRLDENLVWSYFIQMLEGIAHLHSKQILHRDLKTANMFLTLDGHVKIGDMNVSKLAKQGMAATQIGTPYYMSPEIFRGKAYDAKSDIWSLGCILYELVALQVPFKGRDIDELSRRVQTGYYARLPSTYSADLQSIIRACLKLNPKHRPSAEELLSTPIIAERKAMLRQWMNATLDVAAALETEPGDMLATIAAPRGLAHPSKMRQITESLPAARYDSTRGSKGTGGSTSGSGDGPPPRSRVGSLAAEPATSSGSRQPAPAPTRLSAADRAAKAVAEAALARQAGMRRGGGDGMRRAVSEASLPPAEGHARGARAPGSHGPPARHVGRAVQPQYYAGEAGSRAPLGIWSRPQASAQQVHASYASAVGAPSRAAAPQRPAAYPYYRGSGAGGGVDRGRGASRDSHSSAGGGGYRAGAGGVWVKGSSRGPRTPSAGSAARAPSGASRPAVGSGAKYGYHASRGSGGGSRASARGGSYWGAGGGVGKAPPAISPSNVQWYQAGSGAAHGRRRGGGAYNPGRMAAHGARALGQDHVGAPSHAGAAYGRRQAAAKPAVGGYRPAVGVAGHRPSWWG